MSSKISVSVKELHSKIRGICFFCEKSPPRKERVEICLTLFGNKTTSREFFIYPMKFVKCCNNPSCQRAALIFAAEHLGKAPTEGTTEENRDPRDLIRNPLESDYDGDL